MLHTGMYADVIQTTGRLLKVKPSSLEGFLLRGSAYLFQGEEDVALQHYKEGYKSDPDHKELKKAYKTLKAYKKLNDKAQELSTGNQMKELLETVNKALTLFHGDKMVSNPEYDIVTIKLRELQCKAFVKLGQAATAISW